MPVLCLLSPELVEMILLVKNLSTVNATDLNSQIFVSIINHAIRIAYDKLEIHACSKPLAFISKHCVNMKYSGLSYEYRDLRAIKR